MLASRGMNVEVAEFAMRSLRGCRVCAKPATTEPCCKRSCPDAPKSRQLDALNDTEAELRLLQVTTHNISIIEQKVQAVIEPVVESN